MESSAIWNWKVFHPPETCQSSQIHVWRHFNTVIRIPVWTIPIGSQQADWQFALLTNPKPKLMVFRSLDVSRKYTCFLYVFLSTKKSFDMNIFSHEKNSQLASDHYYHRSEVLGPHTAGIRTLSGAQTRSRSCLVSYDCNLKCCSPTSLLWKTINEGWNWLSRIPTFFGVE